MSSLSLYPQCGVCGTVLAGPLGWFFRAAGIRRSARNPNICNRCNTHIQAGRVSEITILFADLSSFTELTQSLGAVRTHEVVDAFLRMATDTLVKHEGTIDKYIGDAVMAWFNVPVPHADHAKRAVRAALDLQAGMAELSARYGLDLKAGVGIASGFAYVGQLGSRDAKDCSVIGDAVNLAARLESKAEGGQIVMTAPVYEAAKEAFPGIAEESLQVKGFKDPVAAYRVGNRRDAASRDERAAAGPAPSRPVSVAAILFAILGAPCAVATLISPLAVVLGAGWLLSALSVGAFIDARPALRFPLIGLALAGASANLYLIRYVRLLRQKSAGNAAYASPTILERRQTLWLKVMSYAAYAIVALEIIFHWLRHHQFI